MASKQRILLNFPLDVCLYGHTRINCMRNICGTISAGYCCNCIPCRGKENEQKEVRLGVQKRVKRFLKILFRILICDLFMNIPASLILRVVKFVRGTYAFFYC